MTEPSIAMIQGTDVEQIYASLSNEHVVSSTIGISKLVLGTGVSTLMPTNVKVRPSLVLAQTSSLTESEHAISTSSSSVFSTSSQEFGSNIFLIPPATIDAPVHSSQVNTDRTQYTTNGGSRANLRPIAIVQPSVAAPSNNFELGADKNVSTIVQRLANRLRTGLSSVKFSGNVPLVAAPLPLNDIATIDGIAAAPLTAIGPEKGMPSKYARHVYIPTKLHKEPRGCKPASNFVPVQVKTTWGRTKARHAAEKAANLEYIGGDVEF